MPKYHMETTQVSYKTLIPNSCFSYTGLNFSQTFNFLLDLQVQHKIISLF